MGKFDYSNPAHLKLRKYRTRAFIAQLYAASSIRPAGAETWAYIAKAWAELADIKDRSNELPPRVAA